MKKLKNKNNEFLQQNTGEKLGNFVTDLQEKL